MNLVPVSNAVQRRPTTHKLKIWPIYFTAVYLGVKTFEIRKNDRDYRVGDWLILQEFNPETQKYTGAEVFRRVNYITTFGMRDGFICMALE